MPHIFYYLLVKMKCNKAGHVTRIGDRRGAYRVLVGWPEGRRSLERRRHIWEYNIKMDLHVMG
jgi:hypothetical protein